LPDLVDDVAYILAAVEQVQLVLEWQTFEGLGYIHDDVHRFDLGGDEVDAVRGWVILDDNLAVHWVDNELTLDWQAAHDLGPEGGARTNPSHVNSHVAEHFHVDATIARDTSLFRLVNF